METKPSSDKRTKAPTEPSDSVHHPGPSVLVDSDLTPTTPTVKNSLSGSGSSSSGTSPTFLSTATAVTMCRHSPNVTPIQTHDLPPRRENILEGQQSSLPSSRWARRKPSLKLVIPQRISSFKTRRTLSDLQGGSTSRDSSASTNVGQNSSVSSQSCLQGDTNSIPASASLVERHVAGASLPKLPAGETSLERAQSVARLDDDEHQGNDQGSDEKSQEVPSVCQNVNSNDTNAGPSESENETDSEPILREVDPLGMHSVLQDGHSDSPSANDYQTINETLTQTGASNRDSPSQKDHQANNEAPTQTGASNRDSPSQNDHQAIDESPTQTGAGNMCDSTNSRLHNHFKATFGHKRIDQNQIAEYRDKLLSIEISNDFLESSTVSAVKEYVPVNTFSPLESVLLIVMAVKLFVATHCRLPRARDILGILDAAQFQNVRIVESFIRLCAEFKGVDNVPYFRTLRAWSLGQRDANTRRDSCRNSMEDSIGLPTQPNGHGCDSDAQQVSTSNRRDHGLDQQNRQCHGLEQQNTQRHGLGEQQITQHHGLGEQQITQHHGLEQRDTQHYGLGEQQITQNHGLGEQQITQHHGLGEQQNTRGADSISNTRADNSSSSTGSDVDGWEGREGDEQFTHVDSEGVEHEEVPAREGNNEPPSSHSLPRPTPNIEVLQLRALENEGKRLKDILKCLICESARAEVTFLPCGHFAACNSCADPCNTCPKCQKQVLAEVKTFLA